VEAMPRGPRFFLDSGNSFFPLPQLPPSRLADAKQKAELIADAYRLLGVSVLVPGPRDFTDGKRTLENLSKRAGVELVAANLISAKGEPFFSVEKRVESLGVRIGVTGAVAENALIEGAKVLPIVDSLKKVKERFASEAGLFTVVLLPDKNWEGEVSKLGFDLLLYPPEKPEGKSLAWQKWDLENKNKEEEKEDDLGPHWEKPTPFSSLYEKHVASIRQAALVRTPSQDPPKSGMFVAQAGTCRSCHEKQYDFWEKTKHASAYLVLFAKNQHFNPECIGCHSLGFYDPKGYRDITAPLRLKDQPVRKPGETPFVEHLMKEVFEADPGSGPLDSREQPTRYAVLKKRYHEKIRGLQEEGKLTSLHMGVQCEHCHGLRDGHPRAGFKKVGKVTPDRCTVCHAPPHDESFNFSKRLPQVACPRQ
jgi:hypothetical protein